MERNVFLDQNTVANYGHNGPFFLFRRLLEPISNSRQLAPLFPGSSLLPVPVGFDLNWRHLCSARQPCQNLALSHETLLAGCQNWRDPSLPVLLAGRPGRAGPTEVWPVGRVARDTPPPCPFPVLRKPENSLLKSTAFQVGTLPETEVQYFPIRTELQNCPFPAALPGG